MPPYGEYRGGYAGGYAQHPPAAPEVYAYAPPPQATTPYGMPPPPQQPQQQPPMMATVPMMAAAAAPPPPAPVAYAPAAVPVVYQQQTQKKSRSVLFGGLRKAASNNHHHASPPLPTAAGGGNLLKATENGMESIYASTPDQIRRAADYNEKESQRLLGSLMSSSSGNRGSKKEMQRITSQAYAHANEAKRLLRKAELLEAEREEREHDEKTLQRRRRARQNCSHYAGCADDVELRQQEDQDDCNMALCGAFGGGSGGFDDGTNSSIQFDAISALHINKPLSIQVNAAAPSYDIKEHTDVARGATKNSARGRSKDRGSGGGGGGVMGFLRGRSKSRDASARKIPGEEPTRDESVSQDGMRSRNPGIIHGIHNLEAEATNSILDHADDNVNDDDSAGYAVAPSNLKVISKVNAPRKKTRRMRPGDVVVDLSAMLILDEERDRVAKPVDMKKRSASFRKTLSRLSGKKGKSKSAQGFIGTDDSDEEETATNDYVDYCITHKKKDGDKSTARTMDGPSGSFRNGCNSRLQIDTSVDVDDGKEAYKEVYAPYKQQLGYGLHTNNAQAFSSLDQGNAEQYSPRTKKGPSMAFDSKSNLGEIAGSPQQRGDGGNEYGDSSSSQYRQSINVTQGPSNRKNKQSVDMMLRRMRSECTEESESRSAANQW